jgi:hypothetical protein
VNDRDPQADFQGLVQSVREVCAEVEVDLGLPSGFVADLPHETDWTFIVKLGAIAEAALNEVIQTAVADERLHPTVSRLRLRGPDGKLALAKDLELLSVSERRFIERVAQLRNSAVHDVHSFSLTFASLLDGMKSNEEPQFWRDLLGVAVDDRKLPSDTTRFRDPAKFLVWIALARFLGRLHMNKKLLSMTRAQEELKRQHDTEQAARFREFLDLFETLDDSTEPYDDDR